MKRPHVVYCFCMLTACTSGTAIVQPNTPLKISDYLVASDVVDTLQREDVVVQGAQQLSSEHAKRFVDCGAIQAARAHYKPRGHVESVLTATVVKFDSARGAFCAYTAGRLASATRVPELDAAFEQNQMLRAWRSNYLIDVQSLGTQKSVPHGRGLLRAMVRHLGLRATPVPGSVMLPDSTLVLGTEQIVIDSALPGVDKPALVALVHCGQAKHGRVFVVEYKDAQEAQRALVQQQNVALESFFELSSFERSGAKGMRIKTPEQTFALFLSGVYIVGIGHAQSLELCDEAVAEVAARAAPL